MIILFFIAALALGLIVVSSTEHVFSDAWQHHKEYHQFLQDRGKWQAESLWSVP